MQGTIIMSITQNITSDYIEVIIDSDFDFENANAAREVFQGVVENHAKNVIVNLNECKFIDSSGIGAIIFLYKRLCCAGLSLTIHCTQPQPNELFNLLKIDQIITIKTYFP